MLICWSHGTGPSSAYPTLKEQLNPIQLQKRAWAVIEGDAQKDEWGIKDEQTKGNFLTSTL